MQNIGLSLMPVFISKINGTYSNYSITMDILAVFGVVAVCLILTAEDARKHYGLELPNMKE